MLTAKKLREIRDGAIATGAGSYVGSNIFGFFKDEGFGLGQAQAFGHLGFALNVVRNAFNEGRQAVGAVGFNLIGSTATTILATALHVYVGTPSTTSYLNAAGMVACLTELLAKYTESQEAPQMQARQPR